MKYQDFINKGLEARKGGGFNTSLESLEKEVTEELKLAYMFLKEGRHEIVIHIQKGSLKETYASMLYTSSENKS